MSMEKTDVVKLFSMCVMVISLVSASALAFIPNPGHRWNESECDNTMCVNSSSGKVGIGTASPVGKLDIVGDANATGYLYGMTGLCMGSDCRTAWPTAAGGWSVYGNYLYNNTTGVSVGIGTSSPASLLSLYRTGNSNTFLNASNGTVNAGIYVGDLSGGYAGASIGTNTNNQFRLFTNSVDRLTIDNSGNVGIGTTNPGGTTGGYATFTKLDVVGPEYIVLRLASSVNNGVYVAGTWLRPIGLANNAGWYLGTNNAGKLRFGYGTDASSEQLAITSAKDGANGITIDNTTGNVGVGTTSPDALLHLSAAGTTYGGRLTQENTQTSSYKWMTGVGGGDNAWVSGRGWFLRDMNVGATRLAVDTSGNVGIGTASPNNKLEVTGGNIALGTAGSIVDFGYGVAGREVNAGKIGYGTFTAGTLNIVGGGTIAPRIVDVWESLRLNGGSVIFSDGTTQATASIGRKAFPVPTSNSFTSEDYIDDQNTGTAMTSGQITNTFREVIYDLGASKHFILNLDVSLYGDATDSQPRLYLYYSHDGSTWYRDYKMDLARSGNFGEIREPLSMSVYARYIKIRSEHYSGSSHASTVRVYEASLIY